MILTIPYQAFEIGNVHVTPFQVDRYGKTIARLTYKDNSIDFQDVSILSPPMRILDYNSDTSRLRLDISEHPHFHCKMNLLHDYLIHTFYVHQQSFLGQQGVPYETIRRLFYFLLDGPALSLFVYPTIMVKHDAQGEAKAQMPPPPPMEPVEKPIRAAHNNPFEYLSDAESRESGLNVHAAPYIPAVQSLFEMYQAMKLAEQTTLRVYDLKPGDRIRCVIRLQGVSQLLNRNELRLRLHHSVPVLWRTY